MRSSTPGLLGACAVLWCACGSRGDLAPLPGPPLDYPYTYAVADCAPWDGAAVTLYFTATPVDSTDLPFPHLRLSVWRSADSLPSHRFAWPNEAQVGAATLCQNPTSCEAATAGEVTFRAREPDGAFTGAITLSFASGPTIRGGFRAPWRRRIAMCG